MHRWHYYRQVSVCPKGCYMCGMSLAGHISVANLHLCNYSIVTDKLISLFMFHDSTATCLLMILQDVASVYMQSAYLMILSICL